MKNPVFILSLFDTGYYAARMLKGTGIAIYGFDHNPDQPGFFSKHITPFLSPHPQEDGERLLEMLIAKRAEFAATPVLIAASEIYLAFINRFRKELSKQFLFLMPAKGTMENILCRSGQLEMAVDAGLDVPYHVNIKTMGQLDEFPDRVGYPLVLKSLDQCLWKKHVKEKAFIISHRSDLKTLGGYLLNKGVPFMVQELIPGEIANNYEYNALLAGGRIVRQHVIKKVFQNPPGSGTACCVRTVANRAVEELGAQFIGGNRIEGFSNTEFKYDPARGKYFFIETNARVWQQIELTGKPGTNYLIDYYDLLTLGSLGDGNGEPREKATWIDLPALGMLVLKHRKEARIGWTKALKLVIRADNRGILSRSDPCPFIRTAILKRGRRP